MADSRQEQADTPLRHHSEVAVLSGGEIENARYAEALCAGVSARLWSTRAASGGSRIVRRHMVGVTRVKALNARQKSLVHVKPHSSAMLSSFDFVSVRSRMPF